MYPVPLTRKVHPLWSYKTQRQLALLPIPNTSFSRSCSLLLIDVLVDGSENPSLTSSFWLLITQYEICTILVSAIMEMWFEHLFQDIDDF